MQILTFDIGGTLIKSAMYDENLGLLDCYEHEYPRAGVEGVLAILRQEIRKNEKDFDAIGISTAGLVDAEKGEIIFREGDRADTGHRALLRQLGFAERELLVEFGYPTQRFVLEPAGGEDA